MSYEDAGGYKIRDQSGTYFMTFTVVGWIDLFTRSCYWDILLKNMRYCQDNKGLKIGAYVIMSNHVHVIWRSENGKLSDTLRDFKSFSTKEFIEAINNEAESRREWLLYMFSFFAKRTNKNKDFKIWTNDNHPEEIFSSDFLNTKLNYIHQNPVRARLVRNSEEYVYSSSIDYNGGKGLTDIDCLT